MRPQIPDTPGGGISAAFLLLPDFTLMAFTGFVEALRHAADRGDRSRQVHCKWTILGTDFRPVRSSCGVAIVPWELLRPLPDYQYLVIVGGLTGAHGQVSPRIVQFIRQCYEAQTRIIGLCTASFILARAGILNSTTCCVHHYHLEQFQREFPQVHAVADQLFVEDGRITTCAGGSGSMDLAIHLVERSFGSRVASKVTGALVYERPRAHNHPQTPLEVDLHPDIQDPIVRRALYIMTYRVRSGLTVEQLSAALAVSTRSLSRRFFAQLRTSPGRYIRHSRIELADRLLQHTDRTVTDIALDCGFSDVSHFARAYRAVRGRTPSRSRETTPVRARA